ncbi:hypothetical protein [Actinokineospora xionganensis]|uniref:EcsC protein family protein n=1 Tax=Actinokineospora xionganensis TaxID=2684470 RepID=A0ABR7LAX3_9PSEU|nr:hypothetical protein [Actinokineospora xionganensis]MBC6449526.1 hypothetical protein [Actinokineospora xionganensis]
MSEDSKTRRSPVRVLENALDRSLETQWKRAFVSVDGHRRRSPNATPDMLAQRIVDEFVRDVSVIGAAGGALAAIPGPGTVVKLIGGTVVETGALLERATYMIMGVAEAYGLGLDEIEVRRYAVLQVLGAWVGASQGAAGLAGTLGAGLGKKATEAIPMTAIHAFNKAMGKQVLFKWASRTGAIRLGSALPFGIGAGIGGTSNYILGKSLGRVAISQCSPTEPELTDNGTCADE